MEAFDRLLDVMRRLRGPDGCPWDREQTHQSLAPYLLEEVYEVLDALRSAQADKIREELGDLLYQILFHAAIAEERGEFGIREVLEETARKMIGRHPHVFGGEKIDDAREVLSRWEGLKERERKQPRESILDGIPRAVPALLRAEQIQARAARVGFDWRRAEEVFVEPKASIIDVVRGEIAELEKAMASGDPRRVEPKASHQVEEELGDCLFSLVNLARHLKVTAEDALRGTTERFIARFRSIEAAARASGKDLSRLGSEEWEDLWRRAKETG